MKYISEELIKALMKNNRLMQGNCEYELWKMTTDKYVSSMPGIDIVRCKECKHREEYPCKVYHDDDWFCADGERSE